MYICIYIYVTCMCVLVFVRTRHRRRKGSVAASTYCGCFARSVRAWLGGPCACSSGKRVTQWSSFVCGHGTRSNVCHLLNYLEREDVALRSLDSPDIRSLLLTGRRTKTRPGDEERTRQYRNFCEIESQLTTDERTISSLGNCARCRDWVRRVAMCQKKNVLSAYWRLERWNLQRQKKIHTVHG